MVANSKKRLCLLKIIIAKIRYEIFRIKIRYLRYLLRKSIKNDYKWDDVFIKVTADKIFIAFIHIHEWVKDDNDYFTYKLKKISVKKINSEIKSLRKIIENKK